MSGLLRRWRVRRAVRRELRPFLEHVVRVADRNAQLARLSADRVEVRAQVVAVGRAWFKWAAVNDRARRARRGGEA